jgi:hypothetical protein
MPALQVLIERGEVCQCLRAKTLFYQAAGRDVLGDAAIATHADSEASSPEGPFWCALTQSLIGPDGQIADAESCRPGRACCET